MKAISSFLLALINGNFKKKLQTINMQMLTLFLWRIKLEYTQSQDFQLIFHKTITQHEFVLGYHLGGLERNGLQFKYNIKMDDFHLQLFTKQANLFNLNSVYGLSIGLGIKYFLDN